MVLALTNYLGPVVSPQSNNLHLGGRPWLHRQDLLDFVPHTQDGAGKDVEVSTSETNLTGEAGEYTLARVSPVFSSNRKQMKPWCHC